MYLAEEIELLIQWGADLHQANRTGLRLVWTHCSDPYVAQISNVQGAVGSHSQRGGSFEPSVSCIAAIS